MELLLSQEYHDDTIKFWWGLRIGRDVKMREEGWHDVMMREGKDTGKGSWDHVMRPDVEMRGEGWHDVMMKDTVKGLGIWEYRILCI